ncbi:MAG: Csu type fimbrial protein [Janthinobacterium lividum]
MLFINSELARLRLATVAVVGFSFLVGLDPVVADAATATSIFQVTATVAGVCLIGTTNLAFGTYSGAQTDVTSTVTATCTNTTLYTVGLSAGSGGTGVAARAMTGPAAATLNYAMFRDNTRTLNWGNTALVDAVAGTGTGSAQAITVYGRLAAGQFATPGAYSDSITATITF